MTISVISSGAWALPGEAPFFLPGRKIMSRKNTRELALKMVFQHSFSLQDCALAREHVNKPVDEEFLDMLVAGVRRYGSQLDEIIGRSSQGWTVDRMPRVDRSVLQLAVFELAATDSPTPVIINEAVELAKRYSDPAGARFINGVLDSIAAKREQLSLQDHG